VDTAAVVGPQEHAPSVFQARRDASDPPLLLDHTKNPALSVSAHQDFKFQVVGRMPKDGWQLTSTEIDMWLLRTEAERAKWDYFAMKWDGAKEEA